LFFLWTNECLTPLFRAGETVAKAIRRLAGGDVGKKRQQVQRKLQQKIKKGQVSRFADFQRSVTLLSEFIFKSFWWFAAFDSLSKVTMELLIVNKGCKMIAKNVETFW